MQSPISYEKVTAAEAAARSVSDPSLWLLDETGDYWCPGSGKYLKVGVGGALAAVGPLAASVLSLHRIYGAVGTSSVTATHHLTVAAPAHYDSVQINLRGSTNSGANAVKVSVAPSAVGGYVPRDAAGVAIPFTPATWGVTDRRDFRNRGGGAASALIQNVVSANNVGGNNFYESDVWSDWAPLQSIPRTDFPARPPLLMLRMQGVNAPGKNVSEVPSVTNPVTLAEPDLVSGYWVNADHTATSDPGSAPTPWGIPGIEVVFMLRGVAVKTLCVAGDSTDQGWITGTSVPQFGGNIDGWARNFAKKLRASGTPLGFACAAQVGDWSIRFHNRVDQMLDTGGITHLATKVWSINESSLGEAGVYAAMRRTEQLLNKCARLGVWMTVVRNWGGQGEGTPARILVDNYIDSLAAQRVPVFDPRIVMDDATGTMKAAFRNVDVNGLVPDGNTHPNALGVDALSSYAVQKRATFGL